MENISYNVNDGGVLRVYMGNTILFELSECQDNTDKEIQELVREVLWERGYNYSGELVRR